jgi:twitching motility protein PilT
MMTKAVAKLIQTDQSHQIPSQMQMGRDLGMQLLDQAMLAAIAAREIDPDDAYGYAMNKAAFQKYVTDTNMLPKVDITAISPAPASTSAA